MDLAFFATELWFSDGGFSGKQGLGFGFKDVGRLGFFSE
jgi:hypothetical protein